MNNPNCIYCQGEQIAGCYCVRIFPMLYPRPYDTHVHDYDVQVTRKAFKYAKQLTDPYIHRKLIFIANLYIQPYAEIRRFIQLEGLKI